MPTLLDSREIGSLGWLPRRLGWLRRSPARPWALAHAPDPLPGPGLLPGYVALGCWRSGRAALDARLELLIAQFSAELSGCRWCIEQGRHQWRKAFLPALLLRQLRSYRTSTLFSPRDCAALGLAEAVVHYTERNPGPADGALAGARHHFTEAEIARIAHLAAGEHFFDPVTGAVGQDVHQPASPGDMPWDAIGSGIGIRGWW
jgi:hypothetical protein